MDVRPRAVDGYLDHVQPPPPMRLAQLRQDVFRQERPVRQDREAHARRDDPVEQFPKIRPQEQFAAAERQAARTAKPPSSRKKSSQRSAGRSRRPTISSA